MLAHWHVARVGRTRVVFGSVEFPESTPPVAISIAGVTYVRQDVAGQDGERHGEPDDEGVIGDGAD